MELQIKIIGILLLVLAAIHLIFPKYFNWEKEFTSVSLINRQMMYVHTFFVALVVFLMGLLCLALSGDLLGTRLGKWIALGLGCFWLLRLYVQFFVYSPELWKGKRKETAIHLAFISLWTYFSCVFFLVFWNSK